MFGNRGPNHYMNDGNSGQSMHQGPMDVRWYQEDRNQMFPYQNPSHNSEWNPYQMQHVPYYPQPFQGYGHNQQQAGYPQTNLGYPNHSYPQKDSQFLFQNPLQPKNDLGPSAYMPMNGYPTMNPYPKQQSIIPKQPGGMQSFINSFKSQDGSVDFNKMMNTAGQMMSAVNQVTSLVKGFGGIFKT